MIVVEDSQGFESTQSQKVNLAAMDPDDLEKLAALRRQNTPESQMEAQRLMDTYASQETKMNLSQGWPPEGGVDDSDAPTVVDADDEQLKRAEAENVQMERERAERVAQAEAAEIEQARVASIESARAKGVDVEAVGEYDGFGGGSNSFAEASLGTATAAATAILHEPGATITTAIHQDRTRSGGSDSQKSFERKSRQNPDASGICLDLCVVWFETHFRRHSRGASTP